MAVFQFTSRRVELDFPGDIHCTLPLTEDMLRRVETAAKGLRDNSATLKGKKGTAEDLEALCDFTLDAVNIILGEGMAEKIMESKEDYTFMDCADLFKFITDEFNAAYIQYVNETKAKAGKNNAVPQNNHTIPAPNRAQRRQKRRHH